MRQKRTRLAGVVGFAALCATMIFFAMGGFENELSSAAVDPAEAHHLAYRFETDNENAVCNDGTKAVYYLRMSSTGNKNWLVYLDGGNACYSNMTCMYRNDTDHSHMTANTAPNGTMEELVSGGEVSILSHDAEVNPHWYDFNTVYVQYCSSDSYLGNISKKDIEWYTPFHFRGAEIVRGVFQSLLDHHKLGDAHDVMLATVSAGSIGALAHSNWIDNFIKSHSHRGRLRVWLDSGFWLLNEPWRPSYAPMDCTTNSWMDCRIDGCQQLTAQYFNAVHNQECRDAHPEYTWECAFPEINWEYQTADFFVSQQQYDKLQIQGAGCSITDQIETEEGLAFVLSRGDEYREALQVVDNLWSSHCRKHDIIDKAVVFSIQVGQAADANIGEKWDSNANYTADEAAWEWFNGGHVVINDKYFYPDANPSCPPY